MYQDDPASARRMEGRVPIRELFLEVYRFVIQCVTFIADTVIARRPPLAFDVRTK
jgi:hypothetical protein